jgi:hypothetical protein
MGQFKESTDNTKDTVLVYRIKHNHCKDYFITSIKRWRNSGYIKEVNMSSSDLTHSFWKSKKLNTARDILSDLEVYYRDQGKECPYSIDEFEQDQ